MAITHDDSTRIAMATITLASLELGSVYPSARMLIYAPDNTVLADVPMAGPAFPTPSALDTPSNLIPDSNALSSGTADHFSICDRNGIARIFGSISPSGSGGDLECDAAIVANTPVGVRNIVYRPPP